jgi:hypothetical protein
MTLTRKRKIYLTILAVGLVALGIDRLVLLPARSEARPAPTAPASAATPAADVPVAPAPETPPVDSASLAAPARITIADRLDRLAEARGYDLTGLPNAFAPSSTWFDVDAAPRVSTASRFRQEHTLNAVMAGDGDGYAIINGKSLFIGHVIDGFMLVEVRERSAVLESQGTRVELALPE